MFARASKEIDAKRKFDATHTRVEEDGAIVGTCAGSNPGDAYDVRVRVRGKDDLTSRSSSRHTRDDAVNSVNSGCSVEHAQENQETHEAPLLVEVSCTCPAARARAFRGDAQEIHPRFGARPAAPVSVAQPPRSCKHSTALLLWRARTLAAEADPDAATDVSVDEARGETHENERTTTRELSERPAPRSAPPPRPAVPPAKKKRRLPPSLAQSAAAAAEAAAGRAKRPAGDSSSREDPEDRVAAVRERKGKGKEKETPEASRAREVIAAPKKVAVKREPGLGDAAAAGDAGTTTSPAPAPGTTTKHSGVSLSRADREVVAKAQTIGDAALLDAARRAMRGAARGAAEGAAEAPASRAARDDALSAARGAPEPRAPSPPRERAAILPPPRSQKGAAPAMKDMFASFLPAAFKAPTGAAASAPAPAPAPAGDSSLENTLRAGAVWIAEPAVLPAVAPSAGGAVSTGAGGEAPAVEGAKGGPKKMSFAELMASGGL